MGIESEVHWGVGSSLPPSSMKVPEVALSKRKVIFLQLAGGREIACEGQVVEPHCLRARVRGFWERQGERVETMDACL